MASFVSFRPNDPAIVLLRKDNLQLVDALDMLTNCEGPCVVVEGQLILTSDRTWIDRFGPQQTICRACAKPLLELKGGFNVTNYACCQIKCPQYLVTIRRTY